MVALLGAAAFALLSFLEISASHGSAAHRTYRVTRGELVVSVVEQGTVESSNNTEIKCQVRGGYGGRGGNSTVTWVVPSGSIVQEGDELVRLDTQVIEETISLGKTDTNIAKAELARAQADAATAEVAVDAYLKGRFRAHNTFHHGRPGQPRLIRPEKRTHPDPQDNPAGTTERGLATWHLPMGESALVSSSLALQALRLAK